MHTDIFEDTILKVGSFIGRTVIGTKSHRSLVRITGQTKTQWEVGTVKLRKKDLTVIGKNSNPNIKYALPTGEFMKQLRSQHMKACYASHHKGILGSGQIESVIDDVCTGSITKQQLRDSLLSNMGAVCDALQAYLVD